MLSTLSPDSPLVVSGKAEMQSRNPPHDMDQSNHTPSPAPAEFDARDGAINSMDALEHHVRNMILSNRPEGPSRGSPIDMDATAASVAQGTHQLTAPQRFEQTRSAGGPSNNAHYSPYPHSGAPPLHPLATHHLHYSHHPAPFPGFNGQFPPVPGQFAFFHQQAYPQHMDFFHHPGHDRQLSDPFAPNFNPNYYPPPGHPALSPPITPFGPPPGAFPLTPNSPSQSFYPQSTIPVGANHSTEPAVPSSSPPKLPEPSPAIPMALMDSRPPFEPRTRPHSKSFSAGPAPPPVVSNEHFPPLGTQRSKPAAWNTPAPSPQQAHFNSHVRDSWHTPALPRTNGQGRPFSGSNNNYQQKPFPKIPSYPEQIEVLQEVANKYIGEAMPSQEEEDARKRLHERLQALCSKVFPGSELHGFGSAVSGFACTGADLDLIFQDSTEHESKLVVAQRLRDIYEEAGYKFLLLDKTRVPILKLDETQEQVDALGENRKPISADIGFGSELAFVNTKLLATYSRCDPRLRQMVMFVKWWSKKRQINVPYKGTLSSYGYVLMVIHYLSNIAKPPVLPNLQHWPVPESTPEELLKKDGYDIWFWQDWAEIDRVAAAGGITTNKEEISSLLRGFFEYYTHNFNWIREVISIRTRGGILTKEEKGWKAAVQRENSDNNSYKDRYLFAIEDPFEVNHNISRTCNLHGVSRIRDEFRRALRLIRFREGEDALRNQLFADPSEEASERPRQGPNGKANGFQGNGQRNGHGPRNGVSDRNGHGPRRDSNGRQSFSNGTTSGQFDGQHAPNSNSFFTSNVAFPALGSNGHQSGTYTTKPTENGINSNGVGMITPPGLESAEVRHQQDEEDQAALKATEKATPAKPKRYQPLIVDGTPLSVKMKASAAR